MRELTNLSHEDANANRTYCSRCNKEVEVRLLMFGKFQCKECGKVWQGILKEHDNESIL